MGLGSEAVETGIRAVDLYPVSKDSWIGPYFEYLLAKVFTVCGKHEQAIDRLEYLISIPCGLDVSIQDLELDPAWDPLRKNPRFKRLIAD